MASLVVEPPSNALSQSLPDVRPPAEPTPRKTSGGGSCVLPYIDSSRGALVKNDGPPVNDFLPPDLVLSLKRQTPGASSKRNAAVSKPPANVWNYPGRRSRLKHLMEQPPCVCGAGRDISFLYDAVQEELESVAGSKVIPNTLIPEEYHVVKHPGVRGLEFHDERYTTNREDHDHHMTIFPSMRPTGRHEAVSLKHAMDQMLQRAGVPTELKDSEMPGPTVMHNLLELVQKEQDIYNICFHELIRQVSVHCVERGELLADIRRRYSNLLDRVPRQVKSLHDEIVAQRALDRRLTSELKKFKSRITTLTCELSEVREHDLDVTEQSTAAQENLASALADSEKNANLLAEYHDLYELQRKRLEDQVANLTVERDVWQQAAYDLTLKVAEEANLQTIKRLQLSEKSWSKLAGHFAIVLSDKDTQQLSEVQGCVQQWREEVVGVVRRLEEVESRMEERLGVVEESIRKWDEDFSNTVEVAVPERARLERLWADMRRWQAVLNEESEHFTGDLLLSRQEELKAVTKLVEQWTEVSIQLFTRHQPNDDSPHSREQEMMVQLNATVETCLSQWGTRLVGENGVATGFIHLITPLETWDTKLSLLLSSDKKLSDSDWTKLKTLVKEWVDQIHKIRGYIGCVQKEGSQESLPLEHLVLEVDKWRSALSYAIDSQDAKSMDQVTQLHSSLVRWMVQLLLSLTGTQVQQVEEGKRQPSLTDLRAEFATLSDALTSFTKLLTRNCMDIVRDIVDHYRTEGYAEPEEEQEELRRLLGEAGEWMKLGGFLLEELADKRERKESDESVIAAESPSATPTQELPEEMNVIGVDDNIHRKSLQVAIQETTVSPAASRSELGLATEEAMPEGRGALEKDTESLVIALDEAKQKLIEQERLTKEEEERAEKAEKELEDSKSTVAQLEAELEQLKLNVEQSRGQTGRGSRSSQKSSRKQSRVQPPSRSENRKF